VEKKAYPSFEAFTIEEEEGSGIWTLSFSYTSFLMEEIFKLLRVIYLFIFI